MRHAFRDRHSVGTYHRQFADDKPWHYGRIPGPDLRRGKGQTSIRDNAIHRTRHFNGRREDDMSELTSERA